MPKTRLDERPPVNSSSSPLDELQLVGRADFTAVASGPFKFSGNPWDAISHEIVIYPRGVSFQLPNFAHRVEDVGGGEIRIKAGKLIVQELAAHYGTDVGAYARCAFRSTVFPALYAYRNSLPQ